MTPEDLDQFLRGAGAEARAYWIEGVHGSRLNDAHYLKRVGSEWVLGYSERGRMDEMARFASFEDAVAPTVLALIRAKVLAKGAYGRLLIRIDEERSRR